MERESLLALVAETVRDYRLTALGVEQPVEPETPLFGAEGGLDSLGLVSVVVELEQRLSDREGREISLMNDQAMSQSRSPFRTVRSLADYAHSQVTAGKPD
jgi:acyl carrier protein